jgi:NitT/TauT family transport system ATP-binding protein
MSQNLLVVREITKSYSYQGHRLPVLQRVSFEVARGQIMAILGPSGAGKSTLLRLLAGLEEPDTGRIWFLGSPARAGHPKLAMMFQDPCLLPWLTVWQNVAFGIQPLGLAPDQVVERVEEVLTWVGLSEVAHWRPERLSGGMAQRVALARALARRPCLLLLDEPFSALDLANRQTLGEMVRQIGAQGVGVVLVTHSVEEALRLADAVLVLSPRPGQIVFSSWGQNPLELEQAIVHTLRTQVQRPLVPIGK